MSAKAAAPRIALACDWLTTPGGAEKVLLELHHMYPDAPIYTSQYKKKGINWFDDADVRAGWLQIFPAALRKFLGPLRQLYFSRLDLTDYDLVISVTGAEAKSLRAKTHLCYCHVPTQYYWQMYDKYVENPGFGPLNPLVRLAFKLLVKPLRKADYAAAQKPTQFITISTYAAAQIEKYYHRDSVIIAPPVEISKFSPNSTAFSPKNRELSTATPTFSTENPQSNANISTKSPDFSTRNPQEIHSKTTTFPLPTVTNPQNPQTSPQEIHKKSTAKPQLFHNFFTVTATAATVDLAQGTHQAYTRHTPGTQPTYNYPPEIPSDPYFVISCRQVTWKRVDLAIEACLKTKSRLLVIGDGPEHKNLVKLAKNSPLITFIPWLETSELAAYLQNAQAYLFPSLEPFGIAAVEALAAGCPVIAYAEGGSRDFVHADGPGKNGLLFSEQTSESLASALKTFNPADFDRETIQNSAKIFSPDVFRQKIAALVAKTAKTTATTPVAKTTPTEEPAKTHSETKTTGELQ